MNKAISWSFEEQDVIYYMQNAKTPRQVVKAMSMLENQKDILDIKTITDSTINAIKRVVAIQRGSEKKESIQSLYKQLHRVIYQKQYQTDVFDVLVSIEDRKSIVKKIVSLDDDEIDENEINDEKIDNEDTEIYPEIPWKKKYNKWVKQMNSEMMDENTARNILQDVLVNLKWQEQRLIDISNIKNDSLIAVFMQEYNQITKNMQNILTNELSSYKWYDNDIMRAKIIIESLIDEIKYSQNPILYIKKLRGNELTPIQSKIKLIKEIFDKIWKKYN